MILHLPIIGLKVILTPLIGKPMTFLNALPNRKRLVGRLGYVCRVGPVCTMKVGSIQSIINHLSCLDIQKSDNYHNINRIGNDKR